MSRVKGLLVSKKSFSFIFAGSSKISLDCLKLLLSIPHLQLKALLTQPDRLKGRGLKKQSSDIKHFAESQKRICWTPQTIKDKTFLKQVAQQKVDFCFVCAYGKILPESYLQLFPKKCLNLHFSLLPKWRGAAPVQKALMAGDNKTGVSLQVMSKKMDAGDIISCREFAITDRDNAQSVFQKSLQQTEDILKKDLIPYLHGELKAYPQDHSQATYADKIHKSMAFIDFSQSARRIHNQIQALVLGPQAFGFIKGQRLKIYQSQVLKSSQIPELIDKSFKAGEVCYQDKNKLCIQCGEGILSLLEVQKEGKKRQSIVEFLKGFPLKIHDRFEASV